MLNFLKSLSSKLLVSIVADWIKNHWVGSIVAIAVGLGWSFQPSKELLLRYLTKQTPVWGTMLFVFVGNVILFLMLRRQALSSLKNKAREKTRAKKIKQLDLKAIELLKTLSNKQSYQLGELYKAMPEIKQAVVDYHLEKLSAIGFIYKGHSHFDGIYCQIKQPGREYLIKNQHI